MTPNPLATYLLCVCIMPCSLVLLCLCVCRSWCVVLCWLLLFWCRKQAKLHKYSNEFQACLVESLRDEKKTMKKTTGKRTFTMFCAWTTSTALYVATPLFVLSVQKLSSLIFTIFATPTKKKSQTQSNWGSWNKYWGSKKWTPKTFAGSKRLPVLRFSPWPRISTTNIHECSKKKSKKDQILPEIRS